MMEGIGSEVSHKIRAAIKAKLIELGAYIDDELPEYIMVMVANKRSRHQMDEDLQLFLGSNTKAFTSWLYTVLQKLQEVTVANIDVKKDTQGNKSSRRKHSNSEDSIRKASKSPEGKSKVNKKHMKKSKESKKLKKSKHKNKDKEKTKNFDKRQASTEVSNDKEKKLDIDKGVIDSCQTESNIAKNNKNKNKDVEINETKLNVSSEANALEKIDKFKHSRPDVSPSRTSSTSHFTDEPIKTKIGNDFEENKSFGQSKFPSKSKEVDDEFNIEPLQPNDLGDQFNYDDLREKDCRSESQDKATGMTIKAPTRELLKEHDKIISESEGNISKDRKKSDQDSEESLSPEEIRKQLLLSRAKKKLEQSKIPGRMKSNSPDVEVLENKSNNKQDDRLSSQRAPCSAKRRRDGDDYEEEEQRSSSSYNRDNSKSNAIRERRSPSKLKHETDGNRNGIASKIEQKNNVISISKSLEMEKNLGVVGEDYKRSKSKENSSPKKKPVPSRVVTIPEPDVPEIPSIVKVKPREYVSKDKQANKVLILKAVADAEKSIATVYSRNDNEVEMKKSEGLFTKNLRGKRYEKLAVTLSNVQGGISDREKTMRVVSVDSENTNALDRKTESLQDSELSQGFRSIPELTLKNISSKSEDQFISSKTSAMEKNDKYIHCWLEGVERAVKDDEIVNPSEIDDFQGPISEEGKEGDKGSMKEQERRRKKLRTEEEKATEETSKNRKSGDRNNASTKVNQEDGPQIVVTLDGLTSRAIKDIILRNRDTPNGPLLGSFSKKSDLTDLEDDGLGFCGKNADLSKEVGTSRRSNSEEREKVSGFEKISERFGRINKTSENHEYKEKYYEFERERYEKKYLKYQGTDKEKHYEKLKDKYASAGESKNRKLIARLSEKFGKVDREFENKKKKYSDEDGRYSYCSRRVDRAPEREGKYRKRDRKSLRSGAYDRIRILLTFQVPAKMYNLYSSSDSSEGEGSSTREVTTLDLSNMTLDTTLLDHNLRIVCDPEYNSAGKFKTMLLYHNSIEFLSPKIAEFSNLKYLDISSNLMQEFPAEICLCPLQTLIAKNNRFNNKSFPSTFSKLTNLKELNFSGNDFTYFPPEVLELKNIKFLYLGGNKISEIPRDIKKMQNLQVLSVGGNKLSEVPATLGQLKKLTALVLSDNRLTYLPRDIARLNNLKSLLLHKNQLKTLPTEIVALKCLKELSLRDNPLVVRFVSDIAHTVPSLLELAARVVKLHSVEYSERDLPLCLVEYLGTAHHCINPKCKGVFFDSRVEHVKFVDFCGKYRVPLLQYLCSSNCIDDKADVSVDSDLMKKVLLG